MKIEVKVKFEGTVTVDIPDSMPEHLVAAEKWAVARIIATTDNPDAPEDAAFIEYYEEALGEDDAPAVHDERFVKIGNEWDQIEGNVNGTWTSEIDVPKEAPAPAEPAAATPPDEVKP